MTSTHDPSSPDIIGLDLHKHESQLCILTSSGEIIERRIRTTAPRFAVVLGTRARARILLEASTESEWVARCLETLGHEVIVADPTYAVMYATRNRRIKTDRRDARALADACCRGTYRPAHRLSDSQRHVRAELIVRESLVRTRSRYVTLIRTLTRRDGLRLPGGQAEHVIKRLVTLELSETLRTELAPLLAFIDPLNSAIAAADRRLAARVAEDPVVACLTTVPGVGPVTACAFVATIDDAGRFLGAHQLEAYLGLVPSERSSGEKQHRGTITKAGNPRVRALLVEAAWNVRRSRRAETATLRAWTEAIAGRRGKSVAIVALARRLAGILYAMWRDGTVYRGNTHRSASQADAVEVAA